MFFFFFSFFFFFCLLVKISTKSQKHLPQNIFLWTIFFHDAATESPGVMDYKTTATNFVRGSWEKSFRPKLEAYSRQLPISDLKNYLQSSTKYLRLTLVFMWNCTLREKFCFCFSRVFLLVLTKFSFRQGDWALGHHSLKFLKIFLIFPKS